MKQEASTKGKLLTVKKACLLYGLDSELVYHWLRYKKFDYHKCGKKLLFWESDFLEFLEKHKVARCDELEI